MGGRARQRAERCAGAVGLEHPRPHRAKVRKGKDAVPAYFIDTSALLPRYLRRATGHKWVADICHPGRGNRIALAEITEVEIASALNQLVRGNTLKRRQRDESLALFWNQVDGGQYTLISVTSAVIRRAAGL